MSPNVPMFDRTMRNVGLPTNDGFATLRLKHQRPIRVLERVKLELSRKVQSRAATDIAGSIPREEHEVSGHDFNRAECAKNINGLLALRDRRIDENAAATAPPLPRHSRTPAEHPSALAANLANTDSSSAPNRNPRGPAVASAAPSAPAHLQTSTPGPIARRKSGSTPFATSSFQWNRHRLPPPSSAPRSVPYSTPQSSAPVSASCPSPNGIHRLLHRPSTAVLPPPKASTQSTSANSRMSSPPSHSSSAHRRGAQSAPGHRRN